MFQNIPHCDILWPDQKENGFQFSKDATDIIKKLLNRNVSERLGYKNDAEEILEHRFFRGIKIKKIVERKFKAPY